MSTSPDENAETVAPSDPGTPLDAPSGAPAVPVVAADAAPARPDPSAEPPFTHTRASGLWAAVVVALLVLAVLLVFVLENNHDVKVTFFGAHGTLPLGVALLFAAIIGGLVVVLAGTARILQLRSRSRQKRRRGRRGRTSVAPSQ